MDLNARPLAPHPDEALPELPTFTFTSDSITDNAVMPAAQTARGGSVSPHLTWSGFPKETQSFFLYCFDPDAPTPAGYWHWGIVDIPADTTELEEGAGESDLTLEGAAFHLLNDAGEARYYGANPPSGDREHRYVFTLYALDVPTLGLDDETTITTASFNALFHALAKASITVTCKQ